MGIFNDELISPQAWMRWPHFKPAEANCPYHEHEAPASGCTCGIHLARDAQYAWTYGRILVKVAGWGRTAVHTAGCRVQYAYPQEIYVSTEAERKLVAKFGVPVFLRSEARGIFPDGRVPAPIRAPIPRFDHRGLKIFVLSVTGSCAVLQIVVFLLGGGTMRVVTAILAWLMFLFLFFVFVVLDD